MAGMFSKANGSDTLSVVKSKLNLDNITITNLWANSTNPAGIGFVNTSKLNLLETGYSFRVRN
jgi:hypothetical protein